jgi:phenylacetate-CoA ligase
MAEWGEPCDCGIALPVIKKLWGRLRHMITHPDGRTTYAVLYTRDFEDLENLEEYRFVLHQNSVVVAQLKVKEPSENLARSVTETVQRALTYPYSVRIQYVDKIDWGLSWKKESFAVSDSPPPDVP